MTKENTEDIVFKKLIKYEKEFLRSFRIEMHFMKYLKI